MPQDRMLLRLHVQPEDVFSQSTEQFSHATLSVQKVVRVSWLFTTMQVYFRIFSSHALQVKDASSTGAGRALMLIPQVYCLLQESRILRNRSSSLVKYISELPTLRHPASV